MVYKGTEIRIVDNTGVVTAKILQTYYHNHAAVGEIVLGVIRKKKKLKAVVKKKINFIFLLGRRKPIFRRRGGYYLRLLRNQGVMLTPEKEKILGSRHHGFLTFESKKTAFIQLLRSCRCLI